MKSLIASFVTHVHCLSLLSVPVLLLLLNCLSMTIPHFPLPDSLLIFLLFDLNYVSVLSRKQWLIWFLQRYSI